MVEEIIIDCSYDCCNNKNTLIYTIPNFCLNNDFDENLNKKYKIDIIIGLINMVIKCNEKLQTLVVKNLNVGRDVTLDNLYYLQLLTRKKLLLITDKGERYDIHSSKNPYLFLERNKLKVVPFYSDELLKIYSFDLRRSFVNLFSYVDVPFTNKQDNSYIYVPEQGNKSLMIVKNGNIYFWIEKFQRLLKLDKAQSKEIELLCQLLCFETSELYPLGTFNIVQNGDGSTNTILFYMSGYTGMYDKGSFTQFKSWFDQAHSESSSRGRYQQTLTRKKYTIYKITDKFHFILPKVFQRNKPEAYENVDDRMTLYNYNIFYEICLNKKVKYI